MIHGSCICNAVNWQFDGSPESATACNCTACRRYGVLWAYDYENEKIAVAGPTRPFIRGDWVEFHFCPACGCVAFWRSQSLEKDGRRRIAVNLRLSEPEAVADIPIRHLDGLNNFEKVSRQTHCVADLWF